MTLNRRNRPISITDAPEHRAIPIDRIEFRDDGDDNTVTLSGYASTFESYSMYGGPEAGGWIEQIGRSAFDKTLREKPDLHLLINHAGMPLARTKSGTLSLSVDDHGLRVDAKLDRRDPEVQALVVKMERGDMDEMSFAFRVKAQEWEATGDFPDDDMALRTITEVSLHKGDVSVVNWGANPTTSASVRSVEEALKIIAECDESQLAEVRSDDDVLRKAAEKLTPAAQVTIQNLHTRIMTPKEIREARAGYDGNDVTCEFRDKDGALVLGLGFDENDRNESGCYTLPFEAWVDSFRKALDIVERSEPVANGHSADIREDIKRAIDDMSADEVGGLVELVQRTLDEFIETLSVIPGIVGLDSAGSIPDVSEAIEGFFRAFFPTGEGVAKDSAAPRSPVFEENLARIKALEGRISDITLAPAGVADLPTGTSLEGRINWDALPNALVDVPSDEDAREEGTSPSDLRMLFEVWDER